MSTASRGPVLVTGGAGFIGCNIADRLAASGHQVTIFDSLTRPGVERNLAWLQSRHGAAIRPIVGDIRDAKAVDQATAGVQAVFHMAAQVAVTTSLSDPTGDFAVNIGGALNVLEALRRRGGQVPIVFASTNKVYGDLADVPLDLAGDAYLPVAAELRAHGISEARRLDFHTPYGCSKGAADQYVLDYARSYGLPTCVLRMSCIYGPRQMGTEDQGWVAHFLIRALRGTPISIYGDGRQVRDIMHVDDAVAAYLAVWRDMDRVRGRAFNLGGGQANAVSLLGLLAHVERLVGRRLDLHFAPWREGDQRYFVADSRAIRGELNLPEPLAWRIGVAHLARWLEQAHGAPAEPLMAEAL